MVADRFTALLGARRGGPLPRLASPDGWTELQRLTAAVRAGDYHDAMAELRACLDAEIPLDATRPLIGLGSPEDRLLYVLLNAFAERHLADWEAHPDNPLGMLSESAFERAQLPAPRSAIRDSVFSLDGSFVYDPDPAFGAFKDTGERMLRALKEQLRTDAGFVGDKPAMLRRWLGDRRQQELHAHLVEVCGGSETEARALGARAADLNLEFAVKAAVVDVIRPHFTNSVDHIRPRLFGELTRQFAAIRDGRLPHAS